VSNDLAIIGRNPWLFGYSDLLPIYSGKDDCLNYWVSWNRNMLDNNVRVDNTSKQQALPPSTPEDDAVDVTSSSDDTNTPVIGYPPFT